MGKRTTPASVLIPFLFLTCVNLGAQLPDASQHTLIHGSIVTPFGRPVDRATVEVRDLHGIKMASSITNIAGSFAIDTASEPGEYVVLVMKELQGEEQRIIFDRPDLEVRIALPVVSESAEDRVLSSYTVSAQALRIPEKARTHVKLAHHEFAKLNFAGAEKELDRALQIDSMCGAVYSMRALLRLASRDLDGAVEDAKRAVLLDSHDADAYIALATAYNSLRIFQKAEEAARHALRIRPDTWQAQLEMAKALYGQGRFVLTLSELDGLNKDFPDVHLVRADVLVRLDRSLEAAAEFSIFLREAPGDPRSEQVRRIVARADHTAFPTSSSSQP